ncbi:kinase-like protein [Aaosphaeria arxii CBS 175.79]|uniref:Kinase-like protein n=1 Tax=Aaosphaeria arxii CBS 175.79 TaxID=1450172 RepID=A0A6A5XCM0_9PLEO|nr:kinase-like protein [Aaosphaeria arxii CBS 175.79]KAF2010742.1 kinase-like protein [Aaosphaeria arxii CBS 175.79]
MNLLADLKMKQTLMGLVAVATGTSGVLFEIGRGRVVKVAYDTPEATEKLVIEEKIYERLGIHPYITRLVYEYNRMIVLEQHVCTMRQHLAYTRHLGERPQKDQVFEWAIWISQALHHAHSQNVLQVDIGPHNVMLTSDAIPKLCDFAGSSIDGSRPSVEPPPHGAYPYMRDGMPSIHSEIFALGSMFYELETTRKPYYKKKPNEIKILFKRGTFPVTRKLVLGEVILKCWRSQYRNVGEIIQDLVRVEEEYMAAEAVRAEAERRRRAAQNQRIRYFLAALNLFYHQCHRR